MRRFGYLDIWTFGHLDIWTFGQLDSWTFGHLDIWIFGYSRPLYLRSVTHCSLVDQKIELCKLEKEIEQYENVTRSKTR
jgi:hypothetical protein